MTLNFANITISDGDFVYADEDGIVVQKKNLNFRKQYDKEIKSVAVLGGGTMGAGIAGLCAERDIKVLILRLIKMQLMLQKIDC